MPPVKDLFERALNMDNGVEEARPIRMSGFYGVLLLTTGQIQTPLCRHCSLLDVFAMLAVLAGRAESCRQTASTHRHMQTSTQVPGPRTQNPEPTTSSSATYTQNQTLPI